MRGHNTPQQPLFCAEAWRPGRQRADLSPEKSLHRTGRARGGDAGEAPPGQVPAGTSVRLHCCPSHTCHDLTALPAAAGGSRAPGQDARFRRDWDIPPASQDPQEWTWGLAGNRGQTEQDKVPWNPPTLGPRTFPGCQSRRLLPVCWRAVLWPIQLPSSPVLGLCVVTGHPALPGLVPVLHPVAASWETPRVVLRGTRQPQCPQQASETGGSHPPPPRGGPGARGPPKPSSGATSWGDGDLESRLGASAVCTCRGHV